MKKLPWIFISLLIIQTQARAIELDYTEARDFSKPASPMAMEAITHAMKNSPFYEMALEPQSSFAFDLMDQVWINEDATQAVMVKLDLKLEDQDLMGKIIKTEDGLLMHGQTASGNYFAAYFHGMSESSVKKYFNTMNASKTARNLNQAWDTLGPNCAHALDVESCKNAITNKASSMREGFKNFFKENKWKCLKNFVKARYGNFLNAILSKISDFKNGTLWKKLSNSTRLMNSVMNALTEAEVLKKLGNFILLPAKTKAEVICTCLGKTGADAQGVLQGATWGTSERSQVQNLFKNNLSSILNSPDTQKQIQAEQAQFNSCPAVAGQVKTVVEQTKNTYQKVRNGTSSSSKKGR